MSFYEALVAADLPVPVARKEDDLPDSVKPIEVADAASEALSESAKLTPDQYQQELAKI
jgi:hypothetical protein